MSEVLYADGARRLSHPKHTEPLPQRYQSRNRACAVSHSKPKSNPESLKLGGKSYV